MSDLSYVNEHSDAWQTYLAQIDRVAPYLEHLADYIDTLNVLSVRLLLTCQS